MIISFSQICFLFFLGYAQQNGSVLEPANQWHTQELTVSLAHFMFINIIVVAETDNGASSLEISTWALVEAPHLTPQGAGLLSIDQHSCPSVVLGTN